jgi:hypothetical protein
MEAMMDATKEVLKNPPTSSEAEKAQYSKPTLTQLGLLRTLTQGYF